MRCAVVRAAFEVYWDAAADEVRYKQEPFCLYDYSTDRINRGEEQAGLPSIRCCRTDSAFDVYPCSYVVTQEQKRAHSALYAENSTMYVKDSWKYCASSPRLEPALIVNVNDKKHGTYDSDAVSDAPTVPIHTDDEERSTVVHSAG